MISQTLHASIWARFAVQQDVPMLCPQTSRGLMMCLWSDAGLQCAGRQAEQGHGSR